ncbi:MAG: hypothetical protein ACK5N6_13960 [Microcystis sp.]|uniref:hypothetical protein n=1 Tax=Microcystis sp. TaxID=1127 RepID=UPI0039192F83
MKQPTANYDEPWKEALTEYFEAFLHFFFPEVHQLIKSSTVEKSNKASLSQVQKTGFSTKPVF